MTQIQNPGAVFGETVQGHQRVEYFIAANSISKGEVVALSTVEGSCIRNLAATARGLQVGVALNTVGSTGNPGITVCTGGFVIANKGTAGMTAGEVVVADNTVSGAVRSLSTATVISIATDVRGIMGTVVATASAAAATCLIYLHPAA